MYFVYILCVHFACTFFRRRDASGAREREKESARESEGDISLREKGRRKMTRSLLTRSFLLREQSESRGRGFSFQARIPSQTLFFSSILFLDFSAPIYCAIRSPLSKWRVVFSGFPWRERERARGRRRRRRRRKKPHTFLFCLLIALPALAPKRPPGSAISPPEAQGNLSRASQPWERPRTACKLGAGGL